MDVQEAPVVVGVKRAACKISSSDDHSLPAWYGKDYNVNTTMPCLEFLKANLAKYLPNTEGLTMGRYGGVVCPVHLLEGRRHTHSHNGVYIGVKVFMFYI